MNTDLSLVSVKNLQGFFCKISLHFTDIGLDITLYNGIM